MGLFAKDKSGGDFPLIPEDLHLAICYGIWDLGTQFSERWGKSVHKVVIVWEIPSCRGKFERNGMEIDLPRSISKQYRLSLHQKAELRKDLESWRGQKFSEEELSKGFDLKRVLGAACQLQILHNKVNDKTYANIAAIIKAPKGTKVSPENTPAFFSFDENIDIPESTPQWIADLIRHAKEYRGDLANQETEFYPDDVPF